MISRKHRNIRQYGDFQTPPDLAFKVCSLLRRLGIDAPAVLEPTCGRGIFLTAAKNFFSSQFFLGVEINAEYVAEARKSLGTVGEVEQGDFFELDWNSIFCRHEGPWLILGNPPWVTNAELGILNSNNLPIKSNLKNHKGYDAIMGKANFDISEWMLLKQIEWLCNRSGWLAMLIKTSVARKILREAWKCQYPVGRASIYKIDAMHHFDVNVDACLFVLPVSVGSTSMNCDVYNDLSATSPSSTIGFRDNILISNMDFYSQQRDLIDCNDYYVWRSGAKHDCSKVMELTLNDDGFFVNGLGESIKIEEKYLFPMLKSSDVANERVRKDRFMIVPQKEIGEDTLGIQNLAPLTFAYLMRHAKLLDGRGSSVYKGKPRFSIFGIGSYTFAPWKIAVSGFYKKLNFMKVGPVKNKPVVFDDTIYFLSCQSEDEADFVLSLLESAPYTELITAMIFKDEKRPITAEILKRISLERVAVKLGKISEFENFTMNYSESKNPRFATG